VSYEVVCHCGQTIRGKRQARHQEVRCPGCSETVFVLPLSPFAVPFEPRPGEAVAPRRWWRAPLLAGLACLAAVLVAFVALRPLLSRPDEQAQKKDNEEEPDLPAKIAAARRVLGQGKFQLARQMLREAVDARDDRPGLLSAEESRRLNHLHRQADLLARLLPVSLEEIVRQGQLVRDPTEWRLKMADYRRGSVVFDDVVRRDVRGRLILGSYVVDADGERVRVALDELTLLRDLPLDDGPRLIFGARLRACEREEGGGWVIRFEPDSGVLLTEPDAVATCLSVAPDRALEQTLAQQQRWVDEQAVIAPARP
jgi:hypothetical protein